MTDQSSAQTPGGQVQHQPPSMPTSPLPKRIKTDDLLNSTTITSDTLPPMSTGPAEGTPTPTPVTGLSNTITSALPPVSSILPEMPAPLTNGSMATLPTPIPSTAAPPALLIQKLNATATTPTRGSAYAAGYDLYAAAAITLPAKSKALISTGLAIAVPPGTYGRVAPRSGLASKHFLDTGAGVIDADYRGEVKVLMFNFSDVDYEVKVGERVAQLVLERIVTPEVVVVEKLEESVRGAGGFGSTGYI